MSRVRAALAARHMTVGDLAELGGLRGAALRRALAPRGNPRLADALAIARVLDRPVAALFALDDEARR